MMHGLFAGIIAVMSKEKTVLLKSGKSAYITHCLKVVFLLDD